MVAFLNEVDIANEVNEHVGCNSRVALKEM